MLYCLLRYAPGSVRMHFDSIRMALYSPHLFFLVLKVPKVQQMSSSIKDVQLVSSQVSNFSSVLKGLTARNTSLMKSLHHIASDYYCIWTEGLTRGRPRHHHIHYVPVYKSNAKSCTVVCKFSTLIPKQCVDTNLSFRNFFFSAFLNRANRVAQLWNACWGFNAQKFSNYWRKTGNISSHIKKQYAVLSIIWGDNALLFQANAASTFSFAADMTPSVALHWSKISKHAGLSHQEMKDSCLSSH